MKVFRVVAALLLLSYCAIVLGINFHYHPGGQDQIGIHCKLCQVSQISLEHASRHSIIPAEPMSQYSQDELVSFSHENQILFLQERSPPLS